MVSNKLLVWRLKRGSQEAMSMVYKKYKDDLLSIAHIASVNMKPCSLYVRTVELNDDGTHAIATCALKRDDVDRFVPKWTYFHNNWWQTDD
jgi:hypothetical protein